MKLGRISISDRILLEWLQFSEGRVVDIRRDHNKVGVLEILIEHPEMPEYSGGDYISQVSPLYITHWHEGCGHKTITRKPLREVNDAT